MTCSAPSNLHACGCHRYSRYAWNIYEEIIMSTSSLAIKHFLACTSDEHNVTTSGSKWSVRRRRSTIYILRQRSALAHYLQHSILTECMTAFTVVVITPSTYSFARLSSLTHPNDASKEIRNEVRLQLRHFMILVDFSCFVIYISLPNVNLWEYFENWEHEKMLHTAYHVEN